MATNINELPGMLITFDLTESEKQLFLEYMSGSRKNNDFDVLLQVFGKKAFMFCDIFSGRSIRVPKRAELYKILTYIQIYVFVRSHGYSDESISKASRMFHKKANSIRRICSHVEDHLRSDMKDVLFNGGK